MNGFRNRRLLLLGAIVLGALLRCWNLGTQSLWIDEVYSLHYASFPLSQIPKELGVASVHPPLYFFLLQLWMKMGFSSDAGVRLFSAVLGVLAIPIFARIASELFDEMTGLVVAFLVAVSMPQILASQEARMYPLLLVTGGLSFLTFLKVLERPTGPRWAMYFLTSVALAYTHVFGLFSIIGQSIFFVICHLWKDLRGDKWKPPQMGSWLICQALILLAFVPWLPSLRHQAGAVGRYHWIEVDQFQELVDWWEPMGTLPLTLLAIALVRSSWEESAKTKGSRLRQVFLAVWFATPIVLALGVAAVHHPIFRPRYFLLGSAPLLIAAAHGLSRPWRNRWIHIAVGLVLALASFQALHHYFAEFQRPDWREAGHFVSANANKDDLVIAAPFFMWSLAERSLSSTHLKVWGFPMHDTINLNLTSDAFQRANFEAQKYTHVWVMICYTSPFIHTGPYSQDYESRVELIAGPAFRVVSVNDFHGVLVLGFEKKGS